ncbi:hypothetical protein PGT21_031404 [Puccinia graminis f. sp. tritici]|uniref:Uncharacterized protein n=1 Tax=Puccinia graminis f. sp. tritici TaxID=56615 RepID=A0A5B0LS75_PUCGR|nr:hypothetical protein PGT21_031404 [Puccinia graminis f. sp. tritici]
MISDDLINIIIHRSKQDQVEPLLVSVHIPNPSIPLPLGSHTYTTGALLRFCFETMSEIYGLSNFEAAFVKSSKLLRNQASESTSKLIAFRNFFKRISNKYRKVFERFSESLSEHISKCTWTKVRDVRPCGRMFRNISERTSEMFRTPAPVV